MENQMPTTPVQPGPNQSMNSKTLIIIICVLIFGIATGVLGFWQYEKMQNSKIVNQNESIVNNANNTNNTNNTNQEQQNLNINQPSDLVPVKTGEDFLSLKKCNNLSTVLASKSGEAVYQDPQYVQNLQIFSPKTPGPELTFISEQDYLVGRLISGQYAGGEMITSILTYGMNQMNWYNFIKLNGKYYLLSKYSDKLLGDADGIKVTSSLVEDNNYNLTDLNFSQNINSTNPSANLSLATAAGFFKNGHDFFCADNLTKLFTDAVAGDVYTDVANNIPERNSQYGFYVKSPNGIKLTYQLKLNFIGQNNIPAVTWNGNIANTAEYSYQAIGGCGVSKFLDVDDISLTVLSVIGKNQQGENIYGFKNSNSKELADMYGAIYTPEGQTKPSYSDFIASHPIFFWQDPFGQMVRFKNTKYMPMAECGKPVIYLYPTQTEKISVKINPLGGLTYSEPLYRNGWEVIASPEGKLINLTDNKNYPYLFWEGRGGMYQTPTRGFVVAKSEVHQFLQDKLALLGLNSQESADFIEYWQPKMQSSPYYFITFMGNEMMDSLAPLTISPKPDTIIRILMDFLPLKQPINVQSYNIRTPIRQGFTVVEWGGVLR